MIDLLITLDGANMKKLATCILKSDLNINGTVSTNQGYGGHEMKINCTMEQMLAFFHFCGKQGIDIEARTLYREPEAASAVVWIV